MSLHRAVATMGSLTLVSRVLGFVRDVLTAAYLGAGPVADAFFVAFKLPNFFRRLFAEGAFNAAFVPSFARVAAERGAAAARAFAEDVQAMLLLALIVLTALAELLMPGLIAVLAPGFAGDPEKQRLAVELSRVTFPYLLFISLVSLQGGVLNSVERFAAVAAAPILLNLALIGAVVALTPLLPSAGHALAWGVAIAGIAQFLWLAWSLERAGLALGLPRPRLTPEVRRMLVLMLPVALGNGVVQINLVVDVMIASFLPTGAVSYLYYADRLYELPLAVIGIAIGTAILPLIARQVRTGQAEAARETQNRGIEIALLLTLPATAGLAVLAEPIIATLFQRGAFGAAETRATAAALMAYSAGLPAYVLIKVLAPGFYAREDTRTPVKIAVLAVAANTTLALALVGPFAHVGIAAATAASAWLNAGLLALGLARLGHWRPDRRLIRRAPPMLLATLGMAAAVYAGARAVEGWLAAGLAARAAALAALMVLGGAVYGLLALVLGAVDRAELRRRLRPGD